MKQCCYITWKNYLEMWFLVYCIFSNKPRKCKFIYSSPGFTSPPQLHRYDGQNDPGRAESSVAFSLKIVAEGDECRQDREEVIIFMYSGLIHAIFYLHYIIFVHISSLESRILIYLICLLTFYDLLYSYKYKY